MQTKVQPQFTEAANQFKEYVRMNHHAQWGEESRHNPDLATDDQRRTAKQAEARYENVSESFCLLCEMRC